MVCWGMCSVMRYLGEKNSRVLKGRDKDLCEVWSIVRPHVFLWASVSKLVFFF